MMIDIALPHGTEHRHLVQGSENVREDPGEVELVPLLLHADEVS